MKRFKHDLTLILGICCFLPAAAQWRVGAYIGTAHNHYSADVQYGDRWAFGTVGITGQYDVLDWLGVRADVTLRYRLREGVVPDRATYEFGHKLQYRDYRVVAPGVFVVDSSSYYGLGVNIGGNSGIKQDEVKAYLDHLVSTPDVLKLSISSSGVKKL